MMAPIVEAITKEKGIDMETLDPDLRPDLEITAVPTFIMVDENGTELKRIIGAMSKPQFEKFLEE